MCLLGRGFHTVVKNDSFPFSTDVRSHSSKQVDNFVKISYYKFKFYELTGKYYNTNIYKKTSKDAKIQIFGPHQTKSS